MILFHCYMHINNTLRHYGTKNPNCKDTKKYFILPKNLAHCVFEASFMLIPRSISSFLEFDSKLFRRRVDFLSNQ